MNIALLLDLPAEVMPGIECVRDDERTLSYQGALAYSQRFAAWLTETLPCGSTIALVQEAGTAHLALLFGAWRAGMIVVPLNFRLRGDDLRIALEVAMPDLVIADERYVLAVRGACGDMHTRPTVVASADADAAAQAASERTLEVDLPDDAVAVRLLTSGTTGRPKAIVMTHEALFLDAVRRMEPPSGISRGLNLVCVPTYHVAGLAQTLSSVYTGRGVRYMRQFSPEAWLRTVAAEHVTNAFVVPTMLRRILDQREFDQTDLTSLQLLSYGAAPASPSLIEEAVMRFPATCDLVNAYGQTETRGTITLLAPEDHRAARTGPQRSQAVERLGSVGRAVPGVEVVIVPRELDHDEALPNGEVGEVAVRREEFDGLLRTGDLGYLDDDGYLFLVGRASDRIIRGGENIDPTEVEAIIERHPQVGEAAVVGRFDEEWGERVVAFVVAASDEPPPTDELATFVRAQLASFKCPDEYHLVHVLPRNSLGKITRNVLREGMALEHD